MISLTEGFYASLLTMIETMSARVSGSRLTSESCPAREKTCSTLASDARWQAVCLKTRKCKGNRIRSGHIISNSFSIPSSALTKRWHSPFERLDHLRISSLTAQSLRTQEHSHHEILLTISASFVATVEVLSVSKHHLTHGGMSCTKFPWWCTDVGELSVYPSS